MPASGMNENIRTLSVVIPVYNEERTIREIVELVQGVELINGIGKELIVVDDGSKDATMELLGKLIREKGYENIRTISKENGGKGSAVRMGFAEVRGEVAIIQDGDLEYDPNDYNRILEVFCDNEKNAQVVYGSRIMGAKSCESEVEGISSIGFYLGGRLVSFVTNILFGTKLTDEPTCYKAFLTSVIREVPFAGNGFEWEPEITARILKKGIKIHEVPISYYPRHVSEGKKISWKDGVKAVLTLLKFRFKS